MGQRDGLLSFSSEFLESYHVGQSTISCRSLGSGCELAYCLVANTSFGASLGTLFSWQEQQLSVSFNGGREMHLHHPNRPFHLARPRRHPWSTGLPLLVFPLLMSGVLLWSWWSCNKMNEEVSLSSVTNLNYSPGSDRILAE
jgi:hypothetical protein